MKIIVIGAGGHAKVVIDALRCAGSTVVGVTDSETGSSQQALLDVPVIGNDDQLDHYQPGDIYLANGVGGAGRAAAFIALKNRGFRFCQVIHPRAVIAESAWLGEGVQVMAGAIIQPMATIGANTIINTNASVDHDCTVSEHAHLAPGSTLCGTVSIGAHCHIGAGSTVIEGLTLDANVFVAAGATVCRNVAAGARVGGTPARALT